MRPEYVKLITSYVVKHPEYKESLHELRNDVLRIGATETEFLEALNQLGLTYNENEVVTKTKPKEQKAGLLKKIQNQPGFTRKLLEIDIVTHVAVAFIVIVPFIIWSMANFAKMNTSPFATASTEISNALKEKQNMISDNDLVPRVYANSDKIDATRVFSYPPSNITLRISGKPKKEVYGFFPYWMIGEQEKINLDELSAIGLFGLEVDGKGNIITSRGEEADGGWAMWNDPKLDELITRAKKKRVRLEITIKAFDKTNIEKLVLSDEAQKIFISNAMHLINVKALDGINLDFEYLGSSSDQVKDGFTRLVTNLNSELKRQFPNGSLTIDTYISAASIPGFFDVELLSENSDALILMGYDIHTPKGAPGPVAPLEGPVSILSFLQSYLEKVPAEKIILAVPYYGYDWPVKVEGTPIGEPGRTLPYAELAELSKGKSITWDEVSQTPSLAYIDAETGISRVVYYENVRSLGAKYDLINKKNLKGMGIWALGYDGLNTDTRALIIEKFAN